MEKSTESRPLAFSTADAARAVGLGVNTLRRAIARGELEHVRIGRAMRVTRGALESWLASRSSRDWRPYEARAEGS